jgi:imidazolonepropionase
MSAIMRRVLLDAGPIVHFAGSNGLDGTDMCDVDQQVMPAGSAIIIEDGVITSLRESAEAEAEFQSTYEDTEVYSLQGSAVIPGLVDAHTHLLWAGDRSQEIRWKQAGVSYADIAERGGGIGHTVRATRAASSEELAVDGIARMESALANGTTHLEAKSGYGLDTETECRLIAIMDNLAHHHNLPSLDITWLGAHDIAPGLNRSEYVEQILSEQLPAVLEQGLARSADVFCEPGWFSCEESEDILRAARAGGLDLRMHIDEFKDGGGGQLAAELKVQSADHAHYTSSQSRADMHAAKVNTGFLPGTPYSQGEKNWPPFQSYIDESWRWSFASDFNPNCQTLSLPFLASVLVQRAGIDPLATLAAATCNPAQTSPHPSGKPHGVIEKGAVANLNILDGENWESWCLRPGHSPFAATVLEGIMISHNS